MKQILAVVLTLLFFPTTALAQAAYDAKALADTRAFADEARSGAVVVIADQRVIAAWGAVDRKFELHSVRKSIYSALWGIAEAKGLVKLEATLAQLGVDDIGALTAEEKKARLADLLHARSGVYHPSAYSPSDMEAALPARGSHAAGTHWFYNNWDFNVAGALLETVTGKPLGVLFDEWIARPLGMQDYRIEDVTVVREPGLSRWPAITMRMSARDLARFGQMWLAGGQWERRTIVPAAWIERASAAVSNTGRPGQGYGMMWWTYEPGSVDAARYPNAAKHRLVLARGTGGQVLAIVRDLDLVIVHRADTDHGRFVKGSDVWTILDRIIGSRGAVTVEPFASQLPPYVRPKAISLDAKTKGALTGEYELQPGVTARVFLHGDSLFAFMPGKGEAELFATSPTEFFVHVDPSVRIRFEDDAVRITMGGKEIVGKRK